ncbi:unnamed protein product [Albugo candida]|uniref:Uncharacterized protein n=1 Tax=Albugo candida TaxID=65357 RepID=A0A024G0G5_9STRA|nr:unnamed protein product [Albugo candida]|eukprot:CCI40254.1 unnamed protein product [Albugo candida]
MKLCLAGWNAEILDRVFRVQRQRQPSFGVSKSDIESFVKDSLVVTAVSLIQIFMLPRLDSQQKVTAEADRLSSSPRFGVMNASNNHCISSSLSVGVYNTDQSIKRFKSSFFPTFRSIEKGLVYFFGCTSNIVEAISVYLLKEDNDTILDWIEYISYRKIRLILSPNCLDRSSILHTAD